MPRGAMDPEELSRLVTDHIRQTPDFPERGVLFQDFSPLLRDPAAMAAVIEDVRARRAGEVDAVVGVEARGFILGAAIAHAMGVGFIPVRKSGKLGGPTRQIAYELEYGTASIEMHTDAVAAGERILVTDDVLATGGTMAACCALIEQAGATVAGIEVVLELSFLRGRQRLPGRDVHPLVRH